MISEVKADVVFWLSMSWTELWSRWQLGGMIYEQDFTGDSMLESHPKAMFGGLTI